MAEVDILLASYNGEKYIAEQIESILAQTFQDFRLIIRDDGSTDRTPEIIGEYEQKYPGRIKVVHDDAVCRHPTKNFFQLMKYATAAYAMFSDQDDYWLPHKIQTELDYVKKTEKEHPDEPVVVFSGLEVVDENLKSFGKYMSVDVDREAYTNFIRLMKVHYNCVTGCTEMMNRAVYANIGDYDELIEFHDHWTAVYACVCGVICHVPEALILYRQHGNNFVGFSVEYRRKDLQNQQTTAKKKKVRKNFILQIIDSVKDSRERFYRPQIIWNMFRSRYAHTMKPEKLRALDDFIEVFSRDRCKRLKAMIRTHYLSDRKPIDRIIHLIKYTLY